MEARIEHIFYPEGGLIRFSRTGPGVYAIEIKFNEESRGKYALDRINEAMAWMFLNTDALMIEAAVAAENKPSLIMARSTRGYKSSELRSNVVHCKATIAQWAKAYGIEKALAEMRASGQSVKADKLEAAARAARVI